MTAPAVRVENLGVRFGDTHAVRDLSFTLDGGRIYGLLGRNGSGKTTLLSVLAAFRRPSAGRVLVDGQEPFENAAVMSRTCFVRDKVDAQESDRVRAVLDFAAHMRPGWDAAYAAKLVELFDLPLNKRITSLSRGTKSALGCTLGGSTGCWAATGPARPRCCRCCPRSASRPRAGRWWAARTRSRTRR